MAGRSEDTTTSERVWVPLGGSSRRYRNRLTGEIISRRQYDKRYGTLSRQGYSSYEAKAKAAKSNEPVQAAKRPARGRRAVRVVRSLDEFKKAWSAVVRSKRGTTHVHVLFAKSRQWQHRLMGRVSRPNIIVDIRMGFDGARFDDSPVTPFFRFLTDWAIRHYKQFLSHRGKLGDRVGVWVGYDFDTSAGKKEEVRIPVREQPLAILSYYLVGIDKQIASFFVDMQSIEPKVRGVMLRILIRR